MRHSIRHTKLHTHNWTQTTRRLNLDTQRYAHTIRHKITHEKSVTQIKIPNQNTHLETHTIGHANVDTHINAKVFSQTTLTHTNRHIQLHTHN